MNKILKQKGFTLVELLIAMSIFVIFVGILMNSYTSIVRAQREANDYRVMYAEARRVFDTVVQELREGTVDYWNAEYGFGNNPSVFINEIESLYLVSKDGRSYSHIRYIPAEESEDSYGKIQLSKNSLLPNQFPGVDRPVFSDYIDLNTSEVNVADFEVYVYPFVDPYSDKYVKDDVFQFHPMVTVFASFEKEKAVGEPYKVDFQTTISSRVYNQIYLPEIEQYAE